MTEEQMQRVSRMVNAELAALEPKPFDAEQKARMVMARNAPRWDYLLRQSVDAPPRIVLTQYRG